MLKAVAKLKNLRRGPGNTGQLNVITRPCGHKQYLTPDLHKFTSFPMSESLYSLANSIEDNGKLTHLASHSDDGTLR